MSVTDELVEILNENGGELSYKEIAEKYQAKYKGRKPVKVEDIRAGLNNDINRIFCDQVSGKWKIVVPTKEKKINIENSSINTIICRVTYMRNYSGISDSDKPANGGAYVAKTGDAEEKYNFLNINDKCYGFVETKHTKDGNDRTLVLENIDSSFTGEKAENVRVVFVALSPKQMETVVVGWYENATVFRERQHHTVNGKDHQYNLVCNYKDAYLIEDGRRKFHVPSATKEGNDFGIGQANTWYLQNYEDAKDYLKDLLKYLDEIII